MLGCLDAIRTIMWHVRCLVSSENFRLSLQSPLRVSAATKHSESYTIRIYLQILIMVPHVLIMNVAHGMRLPLPQATFPRRINRAFGPVSALASNSMGVGVGSFWTGIVDGIILPSVYWSLRDGE